MGIMKIARRMIATRRHRITVLAPVETSTALGGAVTSFQPISTLWGEIAPLSGIEGVEGDHVVARVKARITLRWRGGLSAALRLEAEGRTFGITAVFDPDGRKRHLVVMVEEIAP